ncbi:MAG: hypothetical protein WCW33_00560 [Candidatus Babeliales bacterium]
MKAFFVYFLLFAEISQIFSLEAMKKDQRFDVSPLNLAGIKYLTKKTFVIGKETYTFERVIKEHHLPRQEFTQLVYALTVDCTDDIPKTGWMLHGGIVTLTLRSEPNGEVFISAINEPELLCYSLHHPNRIKHVKLPVRSAHYSIKDALYLRLRKPCNPIIRVLKKSLGCMFDMLLMAQGKFDEVNQLLCAKCQESIFKITTDGFTECDAHAYLGTCKHIVHLNCLPQCLTIIDPSVCKKKVAEEKDDTEEEKYGAVDGDPSSSEEKEERAEDEDAGQCYLCPQCQLPSRIENIFSIDFFVIA